MIFTLRSQNCFASSENMRVSSKPKIFKQSQNNFFTIKIMRFALSIIIYAWIKFTNVNLQRKLSDFCLVRLKPIAKHSRKNSSILLTSRSLQEFPFLSKNIRSARLLSIDQSSLSLTRRKSPLCEALKNVQDVVIKFKKERRAYIS